MDVMPHLICLTRKTGETFGIAVAHIVAIVPMKDGSCEILTTPGVVYAVQETEHEIDRKWR